MLPAKFDKIRLRVNVTNDVCENNYDDRDDDKNNIDYSDGDKNNNETRIMRF